MAEDHLDWNLEDILQGNSIEGLVTEIETGISRYSNYFTSLQPSMSQKKFKEFLLFEQDLTDKFYRLCCLGELMASTDINDEKSTFIRSKTSNLAEQWERTCIPIQNWIAGKEIKDKKRLNDKNFKRLRKAVPGLRYELDCIRDSSSITLEVREEIIIANKKQTVEVLKKLHQIVETEFTYKYKPRGAKKARRIAAQSELLEKFSSPRAREREAAYRSLITKYKENVNKLFPIYQGVVRDYVFESKIRGFDSPLEMKSTEDDVSVDTIKKVLNICSKNTDVFQRFFAFKAKKLGINKLRRFDIYAPLRTKKTEPIPFDEACEMVLNTFEKFSPRFYEEAMKVINEKHIHSHPSKFKESGAYCMSVSPTVTPYLLLNHDDSMESVTELAHELGHAVHFLMANKQLPSVVDTSTPLCETASTFAENILFEKLVESTPKSVRRNLLFEKLNYAYQGIMRQAYFAKFEIAAFDTIPQGISQEELSNIYFKTLTSHLGDSIDIDPIFKDEWAYIPHLFRSPMYCYSYAFGELLSLSLYQEYKKEGQLFVPKLSNVFSVSIYFLLSK